MRCCCGKKQIDEPIIINNYVHEPFGPVGNFCGPLKDHKIRDLQNRIIELEETIKNKEKNNV